MADDQPFYAPNLKPRAPRQPNPGEVLWRKEHNGATWRCELRNQGEYGFEAQIFRDDWLVIGRRFELREMAAAWGAKQVDTLHGMDTDDDATKL